VVASSREGVDVATRLGQVRQRLEDACARAGRKLEEVRLIGVTKGVPPRSVRAAWEAGLKDFGENYARDLAGKRGAAPEGVWHFIGRLQRNKVRRILEVADVVHSLEPGGATRRVAEVARETGPIDCLVEVDFTGVRVGVSPEDVEPFLETLEEESGLRMLGLMTVPPLDQAPRPFFARLRELRDQLRPVHEGLRELSMGMSADYEEAVEEGATMVRVGTAIFGPRPGAVRGEPRAGKP
jgi:pyridoxal phosphate enzyme (YggS family)